MTQNSLSTRPPWTVWACVATSWFVATWLLLDSLHARLFGDYVRWGGELGPWASLAQAVGLNPLDLSWTFILLGSMLFSSSFGLLWRSRWAFNMGLAAYLVLLLYVGLGSTPFIVFGLAMLWLPQTRVYLQSKAKN